MARRVLSKPHRKAQRNINTDDFSARSLLEKEEQSRLSTRVLTDSEVPENMIIILTQIPCSAAAEFMLFIWIFGAKCRFILDCICSSGTSGTLGTMDMTGNWGMVGTGEPFLWLRTQTKHQVLSREASSVLVINFMKMNCTKYRACLLYW